jgi:Kef-type K+ transport system membrane component KefB
MTKVLKYSTPQLWIDEERSFTESGQMNGIDLLRDLAMMLAVSAGVTVLFQYLRQPVILGYILTGILIGPNTPPFSLIRNEQAIRTLAELGVILLMFTIGIHFSFRKLRQVGSSAVVGSLTELTGIFILGNLVGRWLGWSATESLFLGIILGMTSTTIMAKSLDSRGMLYHGFTKLAFGITLMEDIVAVGVLGILNSLGTTGHLGLADTGIKILQLIAFFGAIAVVGLLVVPRVIDWVTRVQSDETLLITVLGLVFLASWAAQAMGFSVALGAFLIGAVLAEVRQVKRVERLVAPVKDVFSALFFTASGMLIQLDFSGSGFFPVLVIAATLIFGKVFFCTLGSLLGGAPLRPAVQAGMSLVAIGEFSFVLAAMGMSLGMTDAKLYSTIVLVSAVSTLASPYLMGASEPFEGRALRPTQDGPGFCPKADRTDGFAADLGDGGDFWRRRKLGGIAGPGASDFAGLGVGRAAVLAGGRLGGATGGGGLGAEVPRFLSPHVGDGFPQAGEPREGCRSGKKTDGVVFGRVGRGVFQFLSRGDQLAPDPGRGIAGGPADDRGFGGGGAVEDSDGGLCERAGPDSGDLGDRAG